MQNNDILFNSYPLKVLILKVIGVLLVAKSACFLANYFKHFMLF
jgi:hypothetical protein